MGMLYAAIDISMRKTGRVKMCFVSGGARPRLPSLSAPARAEVKARSADPVRG
jgi:hypothetical protein